VRPPARALSALETRRTHVNTWQTRRVGRGPPDPHARKWRRPRAEQEEQQRTRSSGTCARPSRATRSCSLVGLVIADRKDATQPPGPSDAHTELCACARARLVEAPAPGASPPPSAARLTLPPPLPHPPHTQTSPSAASPPGACAWSSGRTSSPRPVRSVVLEVLLPPPLLPQTADGATAHTIFHGRTPPSTNPPLNHTQPHPTAENFRQLCTGEFMRGGKPTGYKVGWT